MPRLVNALPKYRKHRASGQAVVTLGGCDFYLGPHGTRASKAEYDRLIAEWLQGGRRLPPTGGSPISVVELCARYWRFAKSYYQKNGRSTNVTPGIKCALRYVKDWYGNERAAEFGPLAIKTLRRRMVDDGHSRRYVNDHIDGCSSGPSGSSSFPRRRTPLWPPCQA